MPTRTSNLLGLCLAIAISLQAQEPVCQKRTDLVGSCYEVRGSLRLADGTPSARIFVHGTKRVLGVSPLFVDNNETFNAPKDIRDKASFDKSISGIFLVCPLTRQTAREMREVCIEKGKLTGH